MNRYIPLLLTLLATASHANIDINELYGSVVDSARQAQNSTTVSRDDFNDGPGQNAYAGEAQQANTATTADVATTVSQADYAVRAGTVDYTNTASYATTAGTANKVSSAERNAIINAGKSQNATVQIVNGTWTAVSYDCGWTTTIPSGKKMSGSCKYLKVNGVAIDQHIIGVKTGYCGNDNHAIYHYQCR